MRSLRGVLEYRGCPICHVLDKDESDFMAALQYRTFKEEKARQDVVSGNGYCNFHFHQMARLGSPVGNAILTKDLIDAELQEIEKGTFGPTVRVDCPICRYTDAREAFCLREFSSFLSEKSFRKEYEAMDGLCRIHLKGVLDLLQRGELHAFLHASHTMHLKLLRVELDTFVSKVRSPARDFMEEKDSWLVAIEKWVGKKGLRNSIPVRGGESTEGGRERS